MNRVKHRVRLNLYDNVANRLQELLEQDMRHKAKAKSESYDSFVNEFIWYHIEEQDVLRRYGPFLTWMGVYDNIFSVYDNKLRKTVEIQVVDKELHCREDDTTNCVHIGFCYAVPEVYKKLMEIGFKPLQALIKVSDKKEHQRSINE